MAKSFQLTLDTIGPANFNFSIDSNAQYTTDLLVDLVLTTDDGAIGTLTGYQMKIYGDGLDLAQAKSDGLISGGATTLLESDAIWVAISSPKQVKISSGDGAKTIKMKIRDSVYNTSSEVTKSITLDMTQPVPNISSGPSATTISLQSGKDTCTFQFTADQIFQAYKVCVVTNESDTQDLGTTIPTAGGSTGISATGLNVGIGTPTSVTIKGADINSISSAQGARWIKVFVQDMAGIWST